MFAHGAVAVGAVYGTVAAEVTNTATGSDYVGLAVGSCVSIVIALIGLYAARSRRRNGPNSEDLSAIAIARIVEANLTTYKAETGARLDQLEKRTGAIEDHVRPWPKERR